MSRINSNVPSLIAQRHLARSQQSLGLSLERLSSGLKINRGKDDPAGLIVSERLRAEISSVNQAVDNSLRAINVIATTEAGLDAVATILNDINALVIEAANKGAFSDAEIAANQLQIDASIDSITRIANTTEFAGRKLLNGQLDYVVSGVSTAQVADVKVLGAKFGSQAFVPVRVNVSASAQQAQLRFLGPGISTTAASVNITGPDGVVTLSFPASATSNEIVTAINTRSDSTGVNATAIGTNGASGVSIQSINYGTNAFLSVKELNNGTGLFNVIDRASATVTHTTGRDATASINGVATTADGLKIKVSDSFLSVEMNLAQNFGGGSTALGTSNFAITSGGALFQLGPEVNTNLQENIGVQSIQANQLGDSIVGFLSQLKSGQNFSLDKEKFKEASQVLDKSITQVSTLRGRLGAFERNTLEPNIAQLRITSENLVSSQSIIRDTNFAQETSELTRSQILVQAGNRVLTIANAQSQSVLSLLGG